MTKLKVTGLDGWEANSKKREKECKKALALINMAINHIARITDNPYIVRQICDDAISSQLKKLIKAGVVIHRD